MSEQNHKLLIFVVAYNAAAHIESLLARISAVIPDLQKYNPEVLVIDDASSDITAALADKFRDKANFPLTVFRNPVNQGYGGNQKIGYQYALRFGFDSVVLLHGDGQYPPELIPQMVEKLQSEQADVVLGSRMLEHENALKGGMPFYKFIGNIVLTTLQNKLLHMQLSEFHTGFRIYRTALLAHMPFAYNSNDFDFDTDILIQAKIANARIAEIPIPTRYGDEICHVNGIKYAAQILRNSLLAKIQKFQIYYHPKFDLEPHMPYDSKVGFDSSHDFAIRQVGAYENVLDIGGSAGHVAQVLRKGKGCHVTGIDEHLHSATRENYDNFIQMNLDNQDIATVFPHNKSVQTVLFLDVIEHLSNPEKFLTSLRNCTAAQNSKIIVTTSNVGFIFTRLSLMIGNFNYGKRGILDFTHKRLFTFGSVRRLLKQYGYTIETIEGIPVPFKLVIKNAGLARILTSLNRIAIFINKGLFSYQIALTARPLPTLDLLLARAEKTQTNMPATRIN